MSWASKIPARLIDFSQKIQPNDNYCIGVEMISSGGGAGTWLHIDEYGNHVDTDATYFDNHPIFSEMTQVLLENSLVMVKIPKFYFRTDNGRKYWISDTEKEGFRLHPAFYKSNGDEVNQIFIGAYQSSIYNNLACSESEPICSTYTTFDNFKAACTGRNSESSGITGYHLWNIYEVSAITCLALIEGATTDFQVKYGQGRTNAQGLGHNSDESVASACYRNISGLWGNAWQYVDGLITDENNKIQMWSNDGKQTFMDTDLVMVSKDNKDTVWLDGKTSGFYSGLQTKQGNFYNFNDIFFPDFNTLTNTFNNGTYSDRVYSRIQGTTRNICCVGGDYNSYEGAGLFSYRYDVNANESYENITGRLAKY